MQLEDIKEYYDAHYKLYADFTDKASQLIREIIDSNCIKCHSVTHRVKTKESLIKKCNDKNYTNIEELMDISGIRIIAFTTNDVDSICSLLRDEFQINNEHSGSKADILDSDKFGYLSVHLIAKLSVNRVHLSEYKRYADIVCEIQVRTMLQHAWAEIEHDKNYKFSTELPRNIKRRFFMLAGVLEMVDGEFQRISDDIDNYAHDVANKINEHKLDIEINSVSLIEFIKKYLRITFDGTHINEQLIDELKSFGITTLENLYELLSDELVEYINRGYDGSENTARGILRDIMILNNAEKYFSNKIYWNMTNSKEIDYWTNYRHCNLDKNKLLNILNEKNFFIYPE